MRASEYYSYGNADALLERAYLAGNIANQINESSAHSAAWEQFRARWHEVETDPYMADGGRYRRRRYSEFLVDVKMQVLERLPHVPYRQPRSVNYLNGDIDRHYTPIAEATIGNVVFQRIVLGGTQLIGEIHPGTTWRVQIFQNRISALANELGKPTPEGVHRDGVDYVLTILGARENIIGGESSVYEADGINSLHSMTLREPGDFLFLDDNLTKHGVTPIACAKSECEGYRDVLVAMYSKV